MPKLEVDLAPIKELLDSAGEECFSEFSRVAADFVIDGANEKLYAKAAKKLNIDRSAVELVVETFISLYKEAAKKQLTPSSLSSYLIESEINGQSATAEQYERVLPYLRSRAPAEPEAQFVDLKWRLDVELATRTRHDKLDPLFTLQLETRSAESIDKSIDKQLLTCDPATLKHVLKQLEQAHAATQSAEYKKMAGHLK